jgi:hypothetical protein
MLAKYMGKVTKYEKRVLAVEKSIEGRERANRVSKRKGKDRQRRLY